MTDDPVAFRVMNEIGIIDQLARTAFERALPDGLTVAQFSVLNHFMRLGGERTPAELARSFQVTKGTMTSTLQRLEAKRLIEVRADPTDGRGKRVAITDKGRAMRNASVSAIAPFLERMETGVGAVALSAILPELRRIRAYLDGERDGRRPQDI